MKRPWAALLFIAASIVMTGVSTSVAQDAQSEYQKKLRRWEAEKKARDEELKRKLLEIEARAKANQAVKKPPPKSVPGATNEPRGVPLEAIGAIVNAVDKRHMNLALAELARHTKNVTLGPVYLVGSLGSFSEDELIEMMQSLGAAPTKFVAQPPDEYRVSRSPTWILFTPQGKVLLEGVRLSTRVNAMGEFVEKGIPR